MKIAVVTGASGGLGKSICMVLADKGFKIVALDLLDTDQLKESLKDLKDSLEMTIGGINFANPSFIAQSLSGFLPNPNWTVLVNNAGVSVGGKLLVSTLEEWNLMMNVNLTAPFVLTQEFAKNSKYNNIRGSIVNIASMVGVVGAMKPGYAASKAGLIGLTKATALQSGPSIRCNAIYPGAINTPLTADWDELTKSKIIANTPMGRIAEPEEIAKIVAFLADEGQSGFLTGAVINATGGQYLGQ